MKKQIRSLYIAGIAAVLFVFYACSAPGGGVGGSTGTISINFGAAASRAAVITDSVLDELTHKVTLTKGSTVVEREFNKGTVTATLQLEPGNWDIKVEASCYGIPVASGESNAKVLAGQSSPVPVHMQARQDIELLTVSSGSEWNAILNTAGSKIVLLTKDIDVSAPVTVTGNITICGDRTVKYTGAAASMLTVNGELVLYDTDLQGSTSPSPFITVNNGGSLSMKGSSSIFGHKNNTPSPINNNDPDDKGGGVLVGGETVNAYGTLTMEDNSSIYGNTANGGGGVFVKRSSSFTMKGNSKVYNNTADDGTGGGSGGGVVAWGQNDTNGSTFIMQDNASIYGNTASTGGGGVSVQGAYFRISGGSIYDNTALSGKALAFNNGGYPTIYKAEYGVFNGSVWSSNGPLSTTDDPIRVVNGQKQ